MSALSISMFQTTSVAYALLGIVIAFVVLLIPSLMVPGAKPSGVVRAISCYMWKTVGLVIVAMTIVQVSYDGIGGRLPDAPLLSALILLFAVGIGIMVQASRIVQSVDEASVVVVRLIFSHTCEMVGGIIALVAAMSMAIMVLLTNSLWDWQMPTTMLIFGVTMMLMSSVHIKIKSGVQYGARTTVKSKKK
jgi:hypothetical protein